MLILPEPDSQGFSDWCSYESEIALTPIVATLGFTVNDTAVMSSSVTSLAGLIWTETIANDSFNIANSGEGTLFYTLTESSHCLL